MTSVTQAVSDTTFSVIVGAGISLWIASLAAMFKVAALLTRLVDKVETLDKQTRLNAANITNLQQRFNVPQADPANLNNNPNLDLTG